MDFRIRNIKNHDSLPLQRQTDSMLSVLRELTEVMKLSHQHLIDVQKERLETKQVLLKIKTSLDQKEQALKGVSQEIKKISEKTVEALTDISHKINIDKRPGEVHESGLSYGIGGKNNSTTTQQKIVRQEFEKKSDQILKKIQEITVTPLQPRNVQINIKNSNKDIGNPEKKNKSIKSDIARLSNKVFSVSFNMFFKEKIDFDKIKAYCSENMLGNLIEMIKQKQITLDQIQMIDQHLSNIVLPYLKLSYPHSEEKETSSQLSSLIVEKDIFNQNRFDLLYNSPIKKMTWHGLQGQDNNNGNNKTQKQFMKLINYIIKLPDQLTNYSQEKTLFESFQQDMTKTFEIIFNKDLIQFINSGDHRILPQYNEKATPDSVTTFLEIIGKSINSIKKQQKISHQSQKEISQIQREGEIIYKAQDWQEDICKFKVIQEGQ